MVEESTSNVVVFPVRGMPMADWYNEARFIAGQHGLEYAQGWIKANVPAQLAPVIEKNVRKRYEDNGYTGHPSQA